MEQTPVVLVADDDPGILKLVRGQLQEDGFHVITAQSGEEALKVAEEQRPDLIVLDLMLPGMSGLDVLRSIRSRAAPESLRGLAVGFGQVSGWGPVPVKGLERWKPIHVGLSFWSDTIGDGRQNKRWRVEPRDARALMSVTGSTCVQQGHF
jgi:CheY-like chemotaxis protein